MSKVINYLTLSYPNFSLGQVIDPDEANQNNSDIASKVNEFVDDVKEAWDLSDGANTKSDTALSTANTAKTTADTALANSATAVTNASTALTKATAVELDYTILKPELQQAVDDANQAVVDMEETIAGTVFSRVGTIVRKGAFVALVDGTTTFTIPSADYNPLYEEITVIYNGVELDLTTNYTMSNRDIVLTFSLLTGESIQYRTVKNVVINPALTDGAFLKDTSVLRTKLDVGVTNELDGFDARLDASELEMLNARKGKATLVAKIDEIDTLYPLNSMYRQAIMNGGFDVWQRGTSFSATSGQRLFVADRWSVYRSSYMHYFSVSKQSSNIASTPNCIRIKRNTGDVNLNNIYLIQNIESINSKPFADKKITLSAKVRMGADFSGTTFLLSIASGTGVDENLSANFTGYVKVSENSVAKSTEWVDVVVTGIVPTNSNQLAVSLSYTPQGTSASNDYVEVTSVQLNVGDIALPFMPKSFAQELQDCLRYYEKSYSYSVAPATISDPGEYVVTTSWGIPNSAMLCTIGFKVQKRTIPTVTLYNPGTGASGSWKATGIASVNVLCIDKNENFFDVSNNYGSTVSAMHTYGHWTADTEL